MSTISVRFAAVGRDGEFVAVVEGFEAVDDERVGWGGEAFHRFAADAVVPSSILCWAGSFRCVLPRELVV